MVTLKELLLPHEIEYLRTSGIDHTKTLREVTVSELSYMALRLIKSRGDERLSECFLCVEALDILMERALKKKLPI